ncbi:MAG: hypothetical protein NC913_09850 [Candidatus Omnitrophica bacterium]|nr:hypothetical protein [Candidatus Omnitrophota bacterium]
MKFKLFIAVYSILNTLCYCFTIEINLKNPSDIPVSCSVSLVRSFTDEYGNWWPDFGYVSKTGLVKQKPGVENFIQPGSESGWIKLPAHGRILACTRLSEKPVSWTVDVKLTQDEKSVLRSFEFSKENAIEYIYLYSVPVSPGPIKLELLTAGEVVDRNLEIVKQVEKQHKGKLPEKIAIYTDCKLLPSDPPDYRKKQYEFLRKLGINGLQYFASDLIPEVIKDGFLYIRHGGAGIAENQYYRNPEEVEKTTGSSALNASGVFERYDAIKFVRNLKLGDEVSSGNLQDYLAYGEKTRLEVIEYLKNKNIPLKDLKVSDYQDIKLKPASLMRIENPGLYYWVNRIRMERINKLFAFAKQANKRYFPDAWSSPNWPVGGYLDGGYEGQGWDLWHLYRNKYLDGIWGEDWPGYEVWLRGGNSYLVDMIKCQAKGLPMGIYNVVEWGYSPVYARYKFYEQLIRGITEIFWYSYGCLRGNEANPWEIKTDIVREIALLNRDAGEAEEYLVNTKLEPASIAVLWTPAQEIWEAEYHVEIIALYYMLLHANYNVDFVSTYDLEDGELKKYKILYMPFSYVEKTAWEKIKNWVEDGGYLIIEGGFLKDECNREIELETWIKGFSAKKVERKQSVGRLPIELPRQQLLDTTSPVSFPVVCSKYVLSIPEKGKCLLTYKDGAPASIEAGKGKGTVRITGFYQGLSYIWDQENRDKAKWGDLLLCHGFSQEMRNFTTQPAAVCKIQKVCDIDRNLVVARKRTGKNHQCIAIFDYGFGSDKPVMPVWDEIGQTTVKLEIGKAKKVKCLNGKLIKEKNFYTVTFKGAAMLLVDL